MAVLMALMVFLRIAQLMGALIFFILWSWFAANGDYRLVLVNLNATGIALDKATLALGFLAAILTLAIAAHGIYYGLKDRYANHRTRFHLFRLFLDFVALGLFLSVILIEVFLPNEGDELDYETPTLRDSYSILAMLAVVGIARLAVMCAFVLTIIGIIVEACKAHSERARIARTQGSWEGKGPNGHQSQSLLPVANDTHENIGSAL